MSACVRACVLRVCACARVCACESLFGFILCLSCIVILICLWSFSSALVEAMHGTLTAESAGLGSGSRFIILLKACTDVNLRKFLKSSYYILFAYASFYRWQRHFYNVYALLKTYTLDQQQV